MLFNSFVFVGFFLIVYFLYLRLRSYPTAQNRLLLVASYVFYGWWDWRFLGLLIVSTLVDFFAASRIESSNDENRRRQFLLLSVITNLLILGSFKYFNFFADSFVSLSDVFGFEPDFVTLTIVLPVGISFYTFQSMGYTIDVYRKKIGPSHNILDYALYVAFFPQLVAGPIERASNLLPQITGHRTIDLDQVKAGLFLILWGYFKKVVIADQMGMIADDVFANHAQNQGIESIVGMLAFTVQIYADFSGYSDIARGLAKLMGFDLMINFKLPYFAKDPAEFWRRWHVSLSSWIRDYLYIPLGGNRHGKVRTYRNLLVSMVLAGLWHGAAWNFVVWGAFHGAMLNVHRLYTDLRPPRADGGMVPGRASILGQIALMFLLTVVGWVIFRSESLEQAVHMFTRISPELSRQGLSMAYDVLFFTWPLVIIELVQHRTGDLLIVTKQRPLIQVAIYSFLLLWIVVFGGREPTEFIYFQF